MSLKHDPLKSWIMVLPAWVYSNQKHAATCSSESSDVESDTSGFFGITKKCLGAWGDMSWNAKHFLIFFSMREIFLKLKCGFNF